MARDRNARVVRGDREAKVSAVAVLSGARMVVDGCLQVGGDHFDLVEEVDVGADQCGGGTEGLVGLGDCPQLKVGVEKVVFVDGDACGHGEALELEGARVVAAVVGVLDLSEVGVGPVDLFG